MPRLCPGYRIKCCEQKVAKVLAVGGERQLSPDRWSAYAIEKSQETRKRVAGFLACKFSAQVG